MTPIEKIVYDIVEELQDKCESEHRSPVSVSMHEISKALTDRAKAALNGFIADGIMTWYPNLNRIPMFTIKKSKD